MATDFFTHQDVARRQTLLLLILFPLALLFLAAVVNGIYFLYTVFSFEWIKAGQAGSPYTPERFILVNLALLGVVLGGSLYRTFTLRGGGARVAESLGGRLLRSGTRDPLERRLLNVVAEMAVASGVPRPRVYLLDQQQGINAFAAGWGPGDAVVTVTRGALELLTRDELQGVVAHEFSHILNGDMRLNMRLMGVLFGIQLVSIIGAYLVERPHMRAGYDIPGTPSPSPHIHGTWFLGFLLWFAGYLGVFFARLIKSAVSRQREYLADASAVQFTRNPEGLARALMKIGGFSYGSRVRHGGSEEASHLFFGSGEGGRTFLSWTATHPPLERRIQRLVPGFNGEFPRLHGEQWFGVREACGGAMGAAESAGVMGLAGGLGASTGVSAAPTGAGEVAAEQVAASVGSPRPAHLAHAHALLASLTPELERLLADPAGARALLQAVLLSSEPDPRQRQLQAIGAAYGEAGRLETLAAERQLAGQPRAHRLPLVELALPALREMEGEQRRHFHALVDRLLRANRRITLFEYALQRVALRYLEGPRDLGFHHTVNSFRPLAEPLALLLSVLARLGGERAGEVAAEAAFRAGAAKLGSAVSLTLQPRERCTLPALDRALERLLHLAPAFKRSLIDACAACVAHDGLVSIGQGELLRTVCAELDCPVPPLLPGQRLHGEGAASPATAAPVDSTPPGEGAPATGHSRP